MVKLSVSKILLSNKAISFFLFVMIKICNQRRICVSLTARRGWASKLSIPMHSPCWKHIWLVHVFFICCLTWVGKRRRNLEQKVVSIISAWKDDYTLVIRDMSSRDGNRKQWKLFRHLCMDGWMGGCKAVLRTTNIKMIATICQKILLGSFCFFLYNWSFSYSDIFYSNLTFLIIWLLIFMVC